MKHESNHESSESPAFTVGSVSGRLDADADADADAEVDAEVDADAEVEADAVRDHLAHLQRELSAAHAVNEHLAARMSGLLDGLPCGALMLDAAGNIRETNPAAVDLLGGPLVGESFSTVLHRAVSVGGAPGEPTGLRSGRLVDISRRELACGGEAVLLTDITESHVTEVFFVRQHVARVFCGQSNAADLDAGTGAPSAVSSAPHAQAIGLRPGLRERERELILATLRATGGSRKLAAERLGISPRTLRHKLQRLKAAGVSVPRLHDIPFATAW